ncbi:MAG: alkaline phytoceramidase [Cytophagales bacterium]|nr:MAG: alkaline phytoceramidase [Cytophagales bacterium]TAF60758.1 MAG: alkaline phytoceramidase [Cytophagales bacterium]
MSKRPLSKKPPQTIHALKVSLLAMASFSILIMVWFFPRIPQNPDYHNFADSRLFWGIPNAADVLSNWGFVIVGCLGILTWFRKIKIEAVTDFQKWAYLLVFIGIACIGLGSAHYHLAPNNHSLLWDRLPMSVVFMGLLSIVLGERVSEPIGKTLFVPLLALGAFSVIYWHYTESRGVGDLRLYGVVQFYTLLFIPAIVLLFDHQEPQQKMAFLKMALFYGLAKVCEHFDDQIFAIGQLISGHSLKHLWAALATYFLIEAFEKRPTTLKRTQYT